MWLELWDVYVKYYKLLYLHIKQATFNNYFFFRLPEIHGFGSVRYTVKMGFHMYTLTFGHRPSKQIGKAK